MPIEVVCRSCGKTMNAKDSAAGKQAKCPDCGGIISIPEPVLDVAEDDGAARQIGKRNEFQPAGDGRTRSPCPLCGQMIITGVTKCRFCGEYLGSSIRGLWRQNNLLVMEKEAALPDRCMKSNAPASRGLKRNLTWHHPAVYLTLLFGPIPYVVVASIVQERAKIVIGLSDEWFARRRRAITLAWTSVVLAGVFICSGMAMASGGDAGDTFAGFAVFAAIVLGIGGIIYGMVGSRLVTPSKMTANHIWLKGVHPGYLADLPDWD